MARHSLMSEFGGLLKENKKWWLLPILAVFTLLGVLIVIGATSAAPFIYAIF